MTTRMFDLTEFWATCPSRVMPAMHECLSVKFQLLSPDFNHKWNVNTFQYIYVFHPEVFVK